ncbi:unnamed protein product [Dicrocoelium dendriticum]|nr:unnamed protein product [Dicrocoelium dendriticum]
MTNAPNSAVTFFLAIFTILVVASRCWNHLIVLFDLSSVETNGQNETVATKDPLLDSILNEPAAVWITDYINLCICFLLFILVCISEPMFQYNALMSSKGSTKKTSVHCFGDKPKFLMADGEPVSDLEPAIPDKSKSEAILKPSPENYASFPSRITYAWFWRLIRRGYRKPLEMSDIWCLDLAHRADHVSAKLFRALDIYVRPKKSFNFYMERRRASSKSAAADSSSFSATGTDPRIDEQPFSPNIHTATKSRAEKTFETNCVNGKIIPTSGVRPINSMTQWHRGSITGNTQAIARQDGTELSASRETDDLASLHHREFALGESNPGSQKQHSNISSISDIPDVLITGRHGHSISQRSVLSPVDTNPTFIPSRPEERNCFTSNQPLDVSDIGYIDTEPEQHSNINADRKQRELDWSRDADDKHPVVGNAESVKHPSYRDSTSGIKVTILSPERPRPSKSRALGLLNALLVTYWGPLLQTGIMKLIFDIMLFFNPMFLKLLLNFIQGTSDEPWWHGYFYAVAMFISAGVQTLILQRYFRNLNILGMHMRTALTAAVYRKSLRLSSKSRNESTTGQIMNLIASDAQQFIHLMPYVHVVWSGPFQIVVAIVLLWRELGPAVLAGIGVLLLLLPLNAVIARLSKSVQEKKFKAADSRIKVISEILNGIRMIKLYAWEPSFIKEVNRLRHEEMKYLRRFTYLHSFSFLWTCAPFLVALSSFGVYVSVSEENILDVQKAFVSLSLFNILRFPLLMFPMVTSNLVQTYVSCRRLDNFLRHIEISPASLSHENTPGVAAVIERGVLGWDPEGDPVLQNISVQFPEGQLTSIMGSVGSGKSSLLRALLGDMEVFSGRLNIRGSVAYVPQEPWIFNDSLRNNVLFLKPYDPVRYKRVIHACGLDPDLLILPNGDQTEIGDKGINLSGGQKQRVSLARACYANADVYLLDDPLSAVDAHVALHLLNQVLSRSSGLLASKTCILATHSLKALPFSDRIVFMANGQIINVGTYRQLAQFRTGRLATFLADSILTDSNQEGSHTSTVPDVLEIQRQLNTNARVNEGRQTHSTETTYFSECKTPQNSDCGEIVQRSGSVRSAVSSLITFPLPADHQHVIPASSEHLDYGDAGYLFGSSISLAIQDNQNAVEESKPIAQNPPISRMMQPETVNKGRVKWSVFKIYLQKMGLMYGLLIIISHPLTHLAMFGTNLWLASWSEDAKVFGNLTDFLIANPDAIHNKSEYPQLASQLQEYESQRDYRLGVYASLGFAQVLFSWVAAITFAIGHLSCAQKLHDALLVGVLHAPPGFFDTIPLGRVVNRFAQDISTLDGPLLQSMKSAFDCFLQCLLTICMACSINPWIIIPIAFLTIVYVVLQNVYVTNSRQLKRLESVNRSPIFSHFSETLLGVDSIRAYGMTEDYVQINSSRLDTDNATTYLNMTAQRWLAVLLETIGNLLILSVTVFCVVTRDRLPAGFSGLVISYALNLNQTLNWLVRMTADLENNIVCVERIDEYTKLEPEAAWEVKETRPAPDWPNGEIQFIDYGIRYRPDLDLVLRSVNIMIKPGEKVGIVGRTGSGKSSLVLGLFRMLEAAEGRIMIDNVDISRLGLHELRQRLALIPQDPVLFSGSLRFNLDPFNEHADEVLWSALELAHLKKYVMETSCSSGLNMLITEGGSNISMGQKQLLCLARALLRRTPILVLDEATAAVDPVTDNLIQETIRSEFSRCTVLTIAHRLNTIMDYDTVLVLSEGRVVESGSPKELLGNQASKFYALAKDANLIN